MVLIVFSAVPKVPLWFTKGRILAFVHFVCTFGPYFRRPDELAGDISLMDAVRADFIANTRQNFDMCCFPECFATPMKIYRRPGSQGTGHAHNRTRESLVLSAGSEGLDERRRAWRFRRSKSRAFARAFRSSIALHILSRNVEYRIPPFITSMSFVCCT